LSTPPAKNKDIAFIKVLADEIDKKHKVDKARVYASGYSGGGFFLNQLSCRVANVFKAFASHAGGAPFPMDGETNDPDECQPCPAGPTPSIHTHGKQDGEVGIESGYYAANCWAGTNACSSSESNNWPAIAPPPCKRAPGCTNDPVELCWVENLGHGQWSEAAAVTWGFFKALP
jgi:polyhydroxybutyrate depolymerase